LRAFHSSTKQHHQFLEVSSITWWQTISEGQAANWGSMQLGQCRCTQRKCRKFKSMVGKL
jgi:hypothetical protein